METIKMNQPNFRRFITYSGEWRIYGEPPYLYFIKQKKGGD